MCRAGGRRCPNCSGKLTGEYAKKHNERRRANYAQKKAILEFAKAQGTSDLLMGTLEKKSLKELRTWAQDKKAPNLLWEKTTTATGAIKQPIVFKNLDALDFGLAPDSGLTVGGVKKSLLTPSLLAKEERLAKELEEASKRKPEASQAFSSPEAQAAYEKLATEFNLRKPGESVQRPHFLTGTWEQREAGMDALNREADARLDSLGVTVKERDALRYYTGDGSEAINPIFYRGKGYESRDMETEMESWDLKSPDHWHDGITYHELARALDSGLGRAESAPFEEYQRVYRGVSLRQDIEFGTSQEEVLKWAEKKFEVGSEVEFPAYTSTSYDPLKAEGFSGRGRGVIFEFATKRGVNVNTISQHKDREFEVLIPRDAKYRIAHVEKVLIDDGPLEERVIVQLVDA